MLALRNTTTNHRDICWSWTTDGWNWAYGQTPIVRHSDVGAVSPGVLGGGRTAAGAIAVARG
ncbi:hypothetical protein ACFC18_52770 [Streptomyces sp. NPDC056121]|uniref:hypothetical protein n=1 Tax=unclassified Streptomyces TaxID=2593676 RepID=UPI0030CA06D8